MSIDPKRCDDIWITLNYQYKDTPPKERKKLFEKFNPAAFTCYQKLYVALPNGVKNALSLAVPLVYLEEHDRAGLILFEQTRPPLLGLPKNQLRTPALAYGVSCAFLQQNPAILADLNALIQSHLPEQQGVSSSYLADSVAKMIGSALIFDPEEFKNALLRSLPESEGTMEELLERGIQ